MILLATLPCIAVASARGHLDIDSAPVNANLANKPALSPTAACDAASGAVSPASETSVIWGWSVLWGEA
jgi:hypothetical protein